MAIPATSREALLHAMHLFRQGGRSPRGPSAGQSWLDDRRHRYAIVHEGTRYPVKETIRLAVHTTTGDWPETFLGGVTTANAYVHRYGFQVEDLPVRTVGA